MRLVLVDEREERQQQHGDDREDEGPAARRVRPREEEPCRDRDEEGRRRRHLAEGAGVDRGDAREDDRRGERSAHHRRLVGAGGDDPHDERGVEDVEGEGEDEWRAGEEGATALGRGIGRAPCEGRGERRGGKHGERRRLVEEERRESRKDRGDECRRRRAAGEPQAAAQREEKEEGRDLGADEAAEPRPRPHEQDRGERSDNPALGRSEDRRHGPSDHGVAGERDEEGRERDADRRAARQRPLQQVAGHVQRPERHLLEAEDPRVEGAELREVEKRAPFLIEGANRPEGEAGNDEEGRDLEGREPAVTHRGAASLAATGTERRDGRSRRDEGEHDAWRVRTPRRGPCRSPRSPRLVALAWRRGQEPTPRTELHREAAPPSARHAARPGTTPTAIGPMRIDRTVPVAPSCFA